MRLRQYARSGMTLFGLLMLLGLFGVLVSLFFPALGRIREAAMRARCTNNQRQLAIAIHNYAINFDSIPKPGDGKNSSWYYQLREYVELGNLTNDELARTAPAMFYCPARRKAELYNDAPKADYAGCAGTADDPAKPGKDKVTRGFFHPDGITLNQVANGDGISHTLLLGEKRLKTTEYLTGKGKGDVESCWHGGTVDTLRSSGGEKRPPGPDDPKEDHERGFGGPHRETLPMTFGDGSVRNIKYTIPGKDFAALCTIAGGEPFPLKD